MFHRQDAEVAEKMLGTLFPFKSEGIRHAEASCSSPGTTTVRLSSQKRPIGRNTGGIFFSLTLWCLKQLGWTPSEKCNAMHHDASFWRCIAGGHQKIGAISDSDNVTTSHLSMKVCPCAGV
jgi:hypothetical protein